MRYYNLIGNLWEADGVKNGLVGWSAAICPSSLKRKMVNLFFNIFRVFFNLIL
jgi:hypothetical protein